MVTSWLKPVLTTLDARLIPLDLFFRNEDAGLADEGLFGFVDLFADHGLPVDLAIVPDTVTPAFADRLLERLRKGYPVGLHQHGYAHINHERGGPLCEFGPSRTAAQQTRDIMMGRDRLRRLFDARIDDIFSPPWDRCTAVTGQSLLECGIRVLSRGGSHPPLEVDGLTECPVWVEWFARQDGASVSRPAWGRRLASIIEATTQPLGISLCQAVMDQEDQVELTALLDLVGRHPNVRGALMRDVAGAMIAAPPAGTF